MPTAYITAPGDVAVEIAETLVSERLAACVNRVDCRSTYRWEGKIHRDDETLLLAKSTDAAFDDLEARVSEVHPHDVPCIERFDEDRVLESFAEWRDSSVGVDR